MILFKQSISYTSFIKLCLGGHTACIFYLLAYKPKIYRKVYIPLILYFTIKYNNIYFNFNFKTYFINCSISNTV